MQSSFFFFFFKCSVFYIKDKTKEVLGIGLIIGPLKLAGEHARKCSEVLTWDWTVFLWGCAQKDHIQTFLVRCCQKLCL